MEKQKIFWVILSVSIFLVVVLVAGVFLLKQKPVGSEDTVSPFTDNGTRIYEYGSESTQSTTSTTPQAPASGTSSGEPEILRFVVGEPAQSPTPPAAQTPQAAMPQQAAPSAASGSGTASRPTPAPAAAPKPAVQAQARPAAPQAAAAQRAAPGAAAQPKTVKVVEYWIQTGAYKSQSRAEELADLLLARGLAGRLFSYASGSGMVYRVRIGPYLNKDEANKFLDIVKGIQGLESSYISAVAGTRTVN